MYKYRITKYNPKYRNNKGHYLIKNEWSAISDINEEYDGDKKSIL